MRIVFLGDSLTWGKYGGSFVDEVAARLPEHDIINAGIGGDTVVNLMERVDGVVEGHQPDAIFVMVGGNDATSYTQPKTRPYYKSAKGLPEGSVTPEKFRTTYRELLTHLLSHRILVAVGLAPTEYNQELMEAKRQYNQIARETAEHLGIPVLDLEAMFAPETPPERPPVDLGFIQQIGERTRTGWDDFENERQRMGYTYTFDGMHITPKTAVAFAEKIVPFLKEHIIHQT